MSLLKRYPQMKQQTLAMAADQNNGFEQSRKPTRREEFLRTMETIVPWAALCQVIEPHYPKAGNGRPPIGLERMLRIRKGLGTAAARNFVVNGEVVVRGGCQPAGGQLLERFTRDFVGGTVCHVRTPVSRTTGCPSVTQPSR